MSDRKYRHRGYMDDDDREEHKQKPRRTPDKGRPYGHEAPRGRGVGSPTAVTFKCAVCGHELKDIAVEFEGTTRTVPQNDIILMNQTVEGVGGLLEISAGAGASTRNAPNSAYSIIPSMV